MTTSARCEIQALALHALARSGGALPLRDLAAASSAGEDALEDALADLAAADLAVVEGGALRPGSRGSPLVAAELAAGLATRRLGRPIEVLAVVDSTNDVVLRRAAAGAAPGLVVVAELQTRGRGRRGRSFDSRPGLGLWSTTLLPAPADPARAPRLSLLAAIAVAGAVERVSGAPASVKWPNDVRIAGRKVAGVLVEARSAGRSLIPVAGIGVNVHHRPEEFPAPLRATAASVEGASGARVGRSALLRELLERLEELLDREGAGRVDLAAEFAPRDETAGRAVVVETDAGPCEGTGSGVSEDGALLLDVPGRGTIPVRAGEASVRALA
jgi:BirA family biotin operon repressor/biotin-[acetyl-CoA-carboxylase] ligase